MCGGRGAGGGAVASRTDRTANAERGTRAVGGEVGRGRRRAEKSGGSGGSGGGAETAGRQTDRLHRPVTCMSRVRLLLPG